MNFNPYKIFRNAGCIIIFLASLLGNFSLLFFGFILVATGVYGSVELTERRVDKIEKELNNAKVKTPEDN